MKTPHLLAAGSANINMTPMIDVVFLLIIFFLVSSHLAKQENSVDLNLPEAVSGLDDELDRSTLVVNVLPDGTWQAGGITLNERTLTKLLREEWRRSERGLRLKIRIDEVVPYQRLEPILQLAAQTGIGDVVFSVYEDRQP